MYYATIRVIESNHNNLRTDFVEGMFHTYPTLHKPFMMYADPIDPDSHVRCINTSVVKYVAIDDINKEVIFRTENSLYALSNIKVATPNSDQSDNLFNRIVL